MWTTERTHQKDWTLLGDPQLHHFMAIVLVCHFYDLSAVAIQISIRSLLAVGLHRFLVWNCQRVTWNTERTRPHSWPYFANSSCTDSFERSNELLVLPTSSLMLRGMFSVSLWSTVFAVNSSTRNVCHSWELDSGFAKFNKTQWMQYNDDGDDAKTWWLTD